MPLLEVKDLQVAYPRRRTGGWRRPPPLVAVNGVSFVVNAGETVGLVGESGCSKSSLGRTLVGLERPASGSVRLDGRELVRATGRELRWLRRQVQMIFQDPYSSLNPRMTVRQMLEEVLAWHHRDMVATARQRRIAELLDLVGLQPEHTRRYPHQFSGGQRQRLGIARALAVEPRLIVADEPVSALDVSVQAQIVNLLQEIQRRTGIAYLFISHDLAVVEQVSRRILVMYLGRIVETGPATCICGTPRHPYTQALLSAVPTLDPVTRRQRLMLSGDIPDPGNPPAGCPFHPRCPQAMDRCRHERPDLRLAPDAPDHAAACFLVDQP